MAEDKYYDEFVEVAMPRKYAIKLKAILSRNPDADIEEVKHGKWLNNNTECSVCHEINPTTSLDEWSLKYMGRQTRRCGNCGAKMDERKETT